jgi:precorrin-6B methylase 1
MPDIFIIGLGIMNVDQLSREAIRAIGESNEVLYVDNGVGTQTFLEGLCPRVTSLFESSYEESGCRLGSYDQMAARVIASALEHPPVTFAMSGHPTVGAEAPFLIQALAKSLGLNVSVQPGISAMDCLFAELMIDPCQSGVQMFEATDLLLRKHSLIPEVPALIWQIGAVETRLHTTRRSKPRRFERFLRHVLQFYPSSHEAVAYFASQHPLMRSQILRFPLGNIGDHAAELHPGFTLYIPPRGQPRVMDADLMARVDHPSHLDDITH